MKKKSFIIILIIFSLVSLCGCQISSNDVALEDEITAPLLNEENYVFNYDAIGGGTEVEIRTPYDMIYYGIPTYLRNIVGDDKVDEWLAQFESVTNPKGRDKWEVTIVNAVKELNVSKEAFKEANVSTYSKEQIEAIYSGDRKLINRSFVNEYALLINDKIYTSSWLAAHTVEDYKKEGITEDILNEYLNKIKDTPLIEDYKNIMNVLESKE
ncbi:hypothetical protein [Alkaliphilus peptidifermentans]|uniref:Uncharacterized protein n=1 Tax=Alkaliphilus peptidifermentans DSM 18978 TaxID=1120976 RepID=A0A1G5FDS3_9FIRM|nr:hypothetical protein [Alkaliphilus peptidifermentans]SCY37415.1 hypothetical protein SAMN03080606_01386 [Alkaliphilus peptidifermentans DSM 18978]